MFNSPSPFFPVLSVHSDVPSSLTYRVTATWCAQVLPSVRLGIISPVATTPVIAFVHSAAAMPPPAPSPSILLPPASSSSSQRAHGDGRVLQSPTPAPRVVWNGVLRALKGRPSSGKAGHSASFVLRQFVALERPSWGLESTENVTERGAHPTKPKRMRCGSRFRACFAPTT